MWRLWNQLATCVVSSLTVAPLLLSSAAVISANPRRLLVVGRVASTAERENFGPQRSFNKVQAKRLHSGHHMWTEKWFPTCDLHRVQKPGWWKRGYRSATVVGGQNKRSANGESNPCFFFLQKNLSHIASVMTFVFALKLVVLFAPCRVRLWIFLCDHFFVQPQ